MAWCRVIQTRLSRLWTGQPVSGCSSMHYHTWFSLLATPQRTVSIAVLLVVPKPWWFMLVQTLLLHLAALAHTEHTCLKCSAQGWPVYFLETINPPNSLRHAKSCKSVMQVEAQVTGSKQNTQLSFPLDPSLYNTSTEQFNAANKWAASIAATFYSVEALKRAQDWHLHVSSPFREPSTELGRVSETLP